jgi:tetratricopeptide (TPR) repeat protein
MPVLKPVLYLVAVGALHAASMAAQTLYVGNNLPAAAARFRAGNDYLQRELWEPAIEEFNAAVKREPLFTDALYGLGQAYMGARRYTSAVYAFNRFIEAAKTVHSYRIAEPGARNRMNIRFEVPAAVLLALGSAHFHQGQVAQAEHYWTQAVKVEPKLGEAWNNLAVIYARSNRRREADKAVIKAESAGYRVNPQLKAEIAGLSDAVSARGPAPPPH